MLFKKTTARSPNSMISGSAVKEEKIRKNPPKNDSSDWVERWISLTQKNYFVIHRCHATAIGTNTGITKITCKNQVLIL